MVLYLGVGITFYYTVILGLVKLRAVLTKKTNAETTPMRTK